MNFADALLCKSKPQKERDAKIDGILEVLGLSHRKDSIVGDDLTRGISGGERRRVTIGVELVKACQLIVMDEATTGLDSRTSLQIFRALRIISDELMPVIATLKQPGRDLLNLFDQVIFLHEGKIIYYGPTDGLSDFFEYELGFPIDRTKNPGDECSLVIKNHGDEILSKLYPNHDEEMENTDENDISDDVNDKSDSTNSINEFESHGEQKRYPTYQRSPFVQFAWCVKRGFQELFNNPKAAIGRLIFAILVALIIGTIFLQIGNEQVDIPAYTATIFIIATFCGFQAVAGLPTIFHTRHIFYYQKENHYFIPLISIFAQILVEMPVSITESVLFSTVCYWLVGLNSEFHRFLFFILVVFIMELMFQLIVKIIGFSMPTFLVGNVVLPPLILGFNFFTGFLIVYSRAPVYLQWLYWVSPFRYMIEGLHINQFVDYEFECADDEFVPPTSDPRYDEPVTDGGFGENQACPITTGEEVLDNFEYYDILYYRWFFLLALIGFLMLTLFLTLLSSYITYKKRTPKDIEKANRIHQERIQKVNLIGDKLPLRNFKTNSDYTSIKPKRIDTNIPIYLEFKDISYYVPIKPNTDDKSKFGKIYTKLSRKKQDLQLLHDVSGYVNPGMLVAFMGPSGAGKSTLLDVLAQRKTVGRKTGEILINGLPLDVNELPKYSGYVEQQNLHLPTDTVKEALLFSANLRLAHTKKNKIENHLKITQLDIQNHVSWVLDVLGLIPLRYSLIGELSLEQKKRVTIGVELAANPSLLFLDEPTSGLDAMAALKIMQAVKNLTEHGVGVVCTLHQPSEQIIEMATHVLLLAKGGKVSYFGLNNNSAIDYFTEQGFEYEEQKNPADFYLDCVSSEKCPINEEITPYEYFHDSKNHENIQKHLENHFVKPSFIPRSKSSHILIRCFNTIRFRLFSNSNDEFSNIPDHNEFSDDLDEIDPPVYEKYYASSYSTQFMLLVNRNILYWWRNPIALILVFFRSILYGLFLGLLLSESDDSQSGIQEHAILLYFIALISGTAALSFVPQIFEDRPVYYREASSRTYDTLIYLISLATIATILVWAMILCLTFPIWALTNLQKTWYASGYFFGTVSIMALIPYGFVLLASAVSPLPEVANGLISIINIVNAYLAGVLLIESQIPPVSLF